MSWRAVLMIRMTFTERMVWAATFSDSMRVAREQRENPPRSAIFDAARKAAAAVEAMRSIGRHRMGFCERDPLIEGDALEYDARDLLEDALTEGR